MALMPKAEITISFTDGVKRTAAGVMSDLIHDCTLFNCVNSPKMAEALALHNAEIADMRAERDNARRQRDEFAELAETRRKERDEAIHRFDLTNEDLCNAIDQRKAMRVERDEAFGRIKQLETSTGYVIVNALRNERDSALRDCQRLIVERDEAMRVREEPTLKVQAELHELRAKLTETETMLGTTARQLAQRSEKLHQLRNVLGSLLIGEF